MRLTPELANLLRKALCDADYFRCLGDLHAAYAELAGAVENLLEPVPAGSGQGPPAGPPAGNEEDLPW